MGPPLPDSASRLLPGPRPRARPGPGRALRHRLAVRLGWIGGAQPSWLSGGRSAATIRLGRGPCALVVKITAAQRTAGPFRHAMAPMTHAHAAVPSRQTCDRTAEPASARPAPASSMACPGSPLFPVDPVLEGRLIAALARRRLAPPPAALFRHGPDICIAYPFQPGRTGHPPDAALARLLRRLHALPAGALPPLPAPPDHTALVARAAHRLLRDPDGQTLVARIDAAADLARRSPPAGAVPLHGDPVPGNVVSGPHGLRLIDWHSAQRGDPCHDLALALSPAMQVIHGLPPRTPRQRATFLVAYGCTRTAARLSATAALHHARMIGHCLWRLDRGDAAYGRACDAEIAALRALPIP